MRQILVVSESTYLKVSVAVHPTANVTEALVEGNQLRDGSLGSWRHGSVRFRLFSRHSVISAVGNHIVGELLPQNNPLPFAVLIQILARSHLPRGAILVDPHAELLRRDEGLRQACLPTILEELDGLRHWHRLAALRIVGILPAKDVTLRSTDEDTRRG